MKKLFFMSLFLLSCSSDVSILKVNEKQQDDTGSVITDNTDTNDTEDNNHQQDTEDTDDTYNPDHDLVIGFVEYSLIQVSCPSCFGMFNEITTTQYARFHEPTGANHYAWVPREDEGCRQYYDSPVSATNVDVGGSIVLVSGNYTHSLSKNYDSTGVIYNGIPQNTDAGYVRDAYYDIIIDGMAVSDESFQSLHGFDYIEPYTMLYTDMSYAYQAPINKTNNLFSWGPSGDQDSFFTVQVSVYSWDGSSYYGTVICRGEDTGQLVIPGSYFASYPSGSLTSIHFIRHRSKEIYSYELQGIIQTHTWWEVIGTGFIQ